VQPLERPPLQVPPTVWPEHSPTTIDTPRRGRGPWLVVGAVIVVACVLAAVAGVAYWRFGTGTSAAPSAGGVLGEVDGCAVYLDVPHLTAYEACPAGTPPNMTVTNSTGSLTVDPADGIRVTGLDTPLTGVGVAAHDRVSFASTNASGQVRTIDFTAAASAEYDSRLAALRSSLDSSNATYRTQTSQAMATLGQQCAAAAGRQETDYLHHDVCGFTASDNTAMDTINNAGTPQAAFAEPVTAFAQAFETCNRLGGTWLVPGNTYACQVRNQQHDIVNWAPLTFRPSL